MADHSPYGEFLKTLGEALAGSSVLVMGDTAAGLAWQIENRARVDGAGMSPPAVKSMDIAAGVAADTSYPDGAFDCVVCSDGLSRLPASERPKQIAECLRLARRECFFLEPHGSIAAGLETRLADLLAQEEVSNLSCLQTRLEHGLPSLGETVGAICDAGFVPAVRRNEGVVQHYLPILAQLPVPVSGLTGVFAWIKGATLDDRLAEKDTPYSVLIAVDKNKRLASVADPFVPLARRVAPGAATGGSGDECITLYATHHKSSPLMDSFRLIRSLDVSGSLPGAALSMKDPQGFFEERNERCSEMSAIHYVWRKKLYGDIIGFCHYRRFLLPEPDSVGEAEIKIGARDMAAWLPRIEDRARFLALLGDCDLLTSRPTSLEFMRQDEQYGMAHYANDYYAMLECAIDRYPWLAPALSESMNSRSLYSANLIVCRQALFDLFCSVWFDVLGCCAARLDPAGRQPYQQRDIGFLSERLFDTLVRHIKRSGFRVRELPRIFVED